MANQAIFNIFTGTLDYVGGGQDLNFLDPVATESLLPTPALNGAICVVQSTNQIYEFSTTSNSWSNVTQKFFDNVYNTSSPTGTHSTTVINANNVNETHVALTVADSVNPGLMSASTQTFSGVKTFNSAIYAQSGVDTSSSATALQLGGINATQVNLGTNLTSDILVQSTYMNLNSGGTYINSVPSSSSLYTNSSGKISGYALTDGQIVVGSTGANPVATTLTGTSNRVTVTNASGSITLSGPQDIATSSSPTFASETLSNSSNQLTLSSSTNSLTLNSGTSVAARTYTIPDVGISSNFVMDQGSQTIAGVKTFSSNVLSSGFDSTSVGGTVGIGYTNASTINIGHSGSTVNILGTTNTVNVTNYNVANKVVNLNTAGPAGSASGVGLDVQENNIVTGYLLTSSDRNSWQMLAPNTAGVVTITPGASGFTLNQGSHNPLSLSTSGLGVSLDAANQILSVQYAASATPGLVSAAAQSFSGDKTFLGSIVTPNLFSSSVLVTDASHNITASSVSTTTLSYLDATSSIQNQLNNKLSLTGGSMTGPISMQSNYIHTVADPLLAQDAATKHYVDALASLVYVTGDLGATTFLGANNQSTAANVTGASFNGTVTRTFQMQLGVMVNATTSLSENFSIDGAYDGTDWVYSYSSVGDSTGVVFSMTTSGQLQYQSPSYSGFTSLKMVFRASTTGV